MNHKAESPRKQLVYLMGTALLLLSITTGAPALTSERIAEKALAATVSLKMKDSTGRTRFGSGFFVKPNQIATNSHVIEGAAQGTAKLVGKDTRYQIEGTVATDEDNDLAVLKVTAYGVTPLPLGDSDTVNIGKTVYVTGNPKGFEGTFSDGLISGRRGSYPKELLQMSAPISPGSSGGPVLNSKGEVIGISVSVHRALDAQNLNFAIPINYLKALLAKVQPAKPLAQNSQSVSAETYFFRGNAKYELGQYAAAISNYTQAIRLKPDSADAYNNRGNAKEGLKEYAAAISDYDTAIRLKPDDANAYVYRGLAKRDLKQYEAAIADYDIAILLKPDDAFAYYMRGFAKALLNRTWEAKQDFRTAWGLAEKAGDTSLKADIEETLRILE